MPPLLLAAIQAGILTQADAEIVARRLDPALARLWAEQKLEQSFGAALSAQQSRLLELLRAADFAPSAAQLNAFWDRETELLWQAVQTDVLDITIERGALAAVAADQTWELVNQSVIDWAEDYYINADLDLVGSIPNLNLTARTQFQKVFVKWQRGELENVVAEGGLPQLIDALQTTFGPARASRIAITETSRLFTESLRMAEKNNEDTVAFRFFTANDEIVCPVCSPFNGKTAAKNSSGFGGLGWPPLHVNCRCEISSESELTLAVDTEAEQAGQPQPVQPKTAQSVREELAGRFVDEQAQLEAIGDEFGQLKEERKKLRQSSFSGQLTAEKANETQGRMDELAGKIKALEIEHTKMKIQIASKARPLVQVDTPTQVNVNLVSKFKSNDPRLAEFESGKAEFEKLISSEVLPPGSTINAKAGGQRSHYIDTEKAMGISPGGKSSVVVHEMGHWLEYSDPAIHEKALAFLDGRTAGEKAQRLSSLFPGRGYRASEITKKDKFQEPYTGKIYIRDGVQNATEIISMGLEHMYEDPIAFATNDPDFFDFIFNLARGQ